MLHSDFDKEVGFEYSSELVRVFIVDELDRLPFPSYMVASYAGIDPANFSRIVNYKTSPTLSTFGRIRAAIKYFKSKA